MLCGHLCICATPSTDELWAMTSCERSKVTGVVLGCRRRSARTRRVARRRSRRKRHPPSPCPQSPPRPRLRHRPPRPRRPRRKRRRTRTRRRTGPEEACLRRRDWHVLHAQPRPACSGSSPVCWMDQRFVTICVFLPEDV